MTIKTKIRTIVIGCSVVVCSGIATDFTINGRHNSGFFISDAEARVGRPRSPGSVAGVARRTTRRTIRRSTRYVDTLPRSCTTVIIEGTSLHHCGSTYYQSDKSKYVVVIVD